ncbi:MAG: DNA polymerase III subunit gamma/tau [Hyphomicrobiales bacterium]|nr:DNA polymerase III subunit gamma/tau [Hyphomicrobiales bacterium]
MTESNPPDKPGIYRVLARKYRPATFADLIGQEALVRTLTNALRSGRLAHAYMLSGVRGVGKTTTARIIARALNCIGPGGQGGPTPEPCGVCSNCEAIANDRHMDVIEMDAASRTRVEEIRDLLDGVPYRPTAARYKVYIVDEVHMLSTHSFNALLKTLEEPPEHVKFVFATTEIRKVPVTVLSRCQRFDLRRVEADTIIRHLESIAEKEDISASAGALRLISRAADGSVRDALSLLDQAIALSDGSVEEHSVREMLGLADRTVTFEMFDSLMQGDAARALQVLTDQYNAGADPNAILTDLLDLTHWVTRMKVVPESASGATVPEAERKLGTAMAEKLKMADVTRVWQMLLKGLNEVRTAPIPIQAAEMVLIRLAYAARLPTPAEAIENLVKPDPSRPIADGGSLPPAERSQPPRLQPSAPASPSPTGRSGGAPSPTALLAEAPPSEVQSRPDPRSFEDVVSLLREHREEILRHHAVADMRLVRFEPGRIDINLNDGAPADLPQRLSRFLREQTGARWLVTVSREQGAPSLDAQWQAAEDARLRQIAQHPLIQDIMKVFPGARIERVRTIPPPEEPKSSDDEDSAGDDLGDGD